MLRGLLDGGLRLVHVKYDEEDERAEALVEQAHDLFATQNIYLHSGYDEFFLLLDKQGRLHAAAAVAVTDEAAGDLSYEVSVVTAPEAQRRGLARRLVGEVIKAAKRLGAELGATTWVEAYVVNQTAMVPLLTSLGFKLDGKYWRLKVHDYEP